jgi:hypothetical protein
MRRRTAGRRPPARSATQPHAPSWREWLPGWLSAAAAIATVVLTIVGFNAITSGQERVPSASLTRWVQGEDEIRYEGEYRELRGEEEAILVMGMPPDATEEEEWTVVRAERTPTSTDDAEGTEDGTWTARMPLAIMEGWSVQVVVARGGLQGVSDPDALEQLRRLGPEAAIVLHASDPVLIEAED